MLTVCPYVVCFIILFWCVYDDELAYKQAFPRAFITWSVSMEGFLGEEGCVPHRGMAYCSPRKIIYFFKENAYYLKIYAVLWQLYAYICDNMDAFNSGLPSSIVLFSFLI